jgi:hypothetical protein
VVMKCASQNVYVSSDLGNNNIGLVCNHRDPPTGTEQFRMVDLPNNRVAIYVPNQRKYCCVYPDAIKCDKTDSNANEAQFRKDAFDTSNTYLKCFDNNYIKLEANGLMKCSESQKDNAEKFQIVSS